MNQAGLEAAGRAYNQLQRRCSVADNLRTPGVERAPIPGKPARACKSTGPQSHPKAMSGALGLFCSPGVVRAGTAAH